MILYSAVKWLSLKHGIPLLCHKNKYLDLFMFDKKELVYDQSMEKQFEKIEVITRETQFNTDLKQKKVVMPKDRISIAVHVRTGVVWENNNFELFQKKYPRKFPSDQYYIDQVETFYVF
ncbi:MAG: hypothetical protein NT124_04150 [Candidatus Dependentiae bacterium]|nr:hypothetical protein [Candidatus Dependentiae bacterium]